MPEMNPRFITEDSSKRRLMYLSDIERDKIGEANKITSRFAQNMI
jgi:hypothetical protein